MARQINNGPFISDDDGLKFIGWVNPDDSETFVATENYRYAYPFTSAVSATIELRNQPNTANIYYVNGMTGP